MPTLEVVDYQSQWPQRFEELRERIWPAVAAHALGLEHVGSTAVPGLAAKPIIDIDVIITADALPAVIVQLESLGYQHRGNLEIEGRAAFGCPPGALAHHLYVCIEGCPAIANHLTIRERLRRDPEAAARYGLLKKQLAAQHPNDIDRYVAGKTGFLLELLAQAGFPEEVQADPGGECAHTAATALTLPPPTICTGITRG